MMVVLMFAVPILLGFIVLAAIVAAFVWLVQQFLKGID